MKKSKRSRVVHNWFTNYSNTSPVFSKTSLAYCTIELNQVHKVMEVIAIIADDLTGAADTGVQFCSSFDETVLVSYHQFSRLFGKASHSESLAIAVYTNSRGLDTGKARKRLNSIASQLSRLKPAWIYKKIDSCLRGNLGAEIEALMDGLGFDLSFIAPAFPEMGRTTLHDVHQVYGVPVGRTEISRDPVTPITESRLSRVIASQSRYPVGHMKLSFLDENETLLAGEIERMVRSGVRHIVFDTTTQDHLDKIAHLTFSFPRKVLPVGSAGLATSIGTLMPTRLKQNEPQIGASSKENVLLISGTTSEITKLQIKALIETYSYEVIPLESDVLADQNRRDDILSQVPLVRSKLPEKNLIIKIVSATHGNGSVKKDEKLRIADSIVEGLGIFVASVLSEAKPGFLFLTGGDTADAVLTAVEAGGIRIYGEIVTGMVQGRLFGGPMDGLSVVTKAGAFGKEDSLVVLHETWKKRQGEKA